MKILKFRSRQYFPYFFVADLIIYSTIVWVVSRLF